jgi:hypothetical protein
MDVKGRTGQRKLKSNESKMKEHASFMDEDV